MVPSQEANSDNLGFFDYLHNNCMLRVHTIYNVMIN